MKTFLLFIFSVTASFAQFPKIIKEPFEVNPGLIVSPKDTVFLGLGSLPSGSFKYVYQKPNVLVAALTPLDKVYNSKFAILKHVEYLENKRFGKQILLLIRLPYFSYYVDLNPAIETGEIIGINQYRFKPKGQAPASVADELLKLKQLLDEGAITQQEYEAQKKRLLN